MDFIFLVSFSIYFFVARRIFYITIYTRVCGEISQLHVNVCTGRGKMAFMLLSTLDDFSVLIRDAALLKQGFKTVISIA